MKTTIKFFLVKIFLCLISFAQAQTPVSKIWDKRYGGSFSDGINSIVTMGDGGFILGGYSTSFAGGDKTENTRGTTDYWIIKISSDGTKYWDKTFGGSEADGLITVAVTTDGGYILGGTSRSGISGDKTAEPRGGRDYWIVKVDAEGNKLWDKAFGGSGEDWFTSLIVTSDGGYLLAGYSFSGANGDKAEANRGQGDYWVVKLNADGAKVWDKTYGGSGNDNLIAIKQTPDGNYILAGRSESNVDNDKLEPSRGKADFWILKIDAEGSKIWEKVYGGEGNDNLSALLPTPDGGFLLGGNSDSNISGEKTEEVRGERDYWLVKIDSNGSKIWDKSFGGSGDDAMHSLLETPDGGYLLGGTSTSNVGNEKSENSKGGIDFWVVKLNYDGEKSWDSTVGGTGDDNLYSMVSASEGTYLLGGNSTSGLGRDKSEDLRGGNDFWIVKIKENVLLGLGAAFNLSDLKVKVYPNPSRGELKFIVHDQITDANTISYTLYNSLGHQVLQKETTTAQARTGITVSTAGLASGVYHLQIVMGKQVVTKKLVLQN
ncbi:T9SS type A sorting domain-containing protein [Pontibacter sp. H249]|uniref:T9SS type A sorting domain-containing protein n=1 Tax=Pontibacter sp. H249 TaxID=3133420 RepID=UPI0030C48199